MPRKIVQGPIRDKERTKQKLMAAVGKIIKTKGYSGLMVSKIAAVAGFDKKLIYEYFGSTEKLIDEYIKTQDYWSQVSKEENIDISDGGREISKQILLDQYESLKKNKELQKIIVWQLSESKPMLRKIIDQREEVGEGLFSSITDQHFGEKSNNYRAIIALLISGIYHLNLFASHNGTKFCGIDVKSDEGRAEIEQAVRDVIDMAYDREAKK